MLKEKESTCTILFSRSFRSFRLLLSLSLLKARHSLDYTVFPLKRGCFSADCCPGSLPSKRQARGNVLKFNYRTWSVCARRKSWPLVIKRLDNTTRSKLSEQDKFHTDVETGGGKHAGQKDTGVNLPSCKPPLLATPMLPTDADNVLGPFPPRPPPFDSSPIPWLFRRDSIEIVASRN